MHSSQRYWPTRSVTVVVVFLALVSITVLANASVYVLPDAELMHDGFYLQWGTGSTLAKSYPTEGPGVLFDVKLAAKTGIGDNWPVDSLAGLAEDPVLGHDNTSLADYSGYQMVVQYLSGPEGSDIDFHLFMNTGLTGGSGEPSNESTNNTFWGGAWVNIPLGQTVTLTLDFDNAEAWNISDNKSPHTGGGLGWANGGWYAINDRDRHEVSNIGIEIADFDGDVSGGQIELLLNAPNPIPPIPEPASLAIWCLLILTFAVAWRRLRR